MKRLRIRRLLAGAFAACLALSCAGTPTYLGPREDVVYASEDRIDYTVTECGVQILLFIPFFNNDRAARALRAIKERAGDRYVTDIRIRERWLYLVLGTIYCTEMIAATFPKEP